LVLDHRSLEARRSDFFFELPQHAEIQRDACLARGADSPERSERRTFVVGGAAAEVTVAVSGEGEGIAVPRFGVAGRGLDVEMVINGERRSVGAGVESAVHE